MTSVSKKSEKILKEVYYDRGITLGRDGLFEYMKQNFQRLIQLEERLCRGSNNTNYIKIYWSKKWRYG